MSYDGLVWYSVPAGAFAPIDVQKEQYAADALQTKGSPVLPSWAKPAGPTQTVFIAASLEEKTPVGGMRILENLAQSHHVPMTWLIGSTAYLVDAAPYTTAHVQNGDDVEAEHGYEPVRRRRWRSAKPRSGDDMEQFRRRYAAGLWRSVGFVLRGRPVVQATLAGRLVRASWV